MKWEEVLQLLATYGYSTKQKTDMYLAMTGVVGDRTFIIEGVVHLTVAFQMFYETREHEVLKEVGTCHNDLLRMGMKDVKVTFSKKRYDEEGDKYTIYAYADFEYEYKV